MVPGWVGGWVVAVLVQARRGPGSHRPFQSLLRERGLRDPGGGALTAGTPVQAEERGGEGARSGQAAQSPAFPFFSPQPLAFLEPPRLQRCPGAPRPAPPERESESVGGAGPASPSKAPAEGRPSRRALGAAPRVAPAEAPEQHQRPVPARTMRLRRPRRPDQAARAGSGAQPRRAAAARSPFRRRAAAAAAAKRRRRRRRPRPGLERPRRVPQPASQLRKGKAACRRPGARGKSLGGVAGPFGMHRGRRLARGAGAGGRGGVGRQHRSRATGRGSFASPSVSGSSPARQRAPFPACGARKRRSRRGGFVSPALEGAFPGPSPRAEQMFLGRRAGLPGAASGGAGLLSGRAAGGSCSPWAGLARSIPLGRPHKSAPPRLLGWFKEGNSRWSLS